MAGRQETAHPEALDPLCVPSMVPRLPVAQCVAFVARPVLDYAGHGVPAPGWLEVGMRRATYPIRGTIAMLVRCTVAAAADFWVCCMIVAMIHLADLALKPS